MNSTRITARVRSLAYAAIVILTVVGIFVAPLAYAKIVYNTIDPVATVSDNGRRILITGPVAGTAGEVGDQRVTVTQRETGAVAEGRTLIRFIGDIQQWEVEAKTRGKASFDAGPATAVAVCRSTDHGHATDAHQWLVDITLEKK